MGWYKFQQLLHLCLIKLFPACRRASLFFFYFTYVSWEFKDSLEFHTRPEGLISTSLEKLWSSAIPYVFLNLYCAILIHILWPCWFIFRQGNPSWKERFHQITHERSRPPYLELSELKSSRSTDIIVDYIMLTLFLQVISNVSLVSPFCLVLSALSFLSIHLYLGSSRYETDHHMNRWSPYSQMPLANYALDQGSPNFSVWAPHWTFKG